MIFIRERRTFNPPLYSMSPNLRNLFMKKLTRERVVPIISASVSWLILAITRSCFAVRAKVGQQEQDPRQPHLAGVEKLIQHILLQPDGTGQQMGEEQCGKTRFVVEHLNRLRFLQSEARSCNSSGPWQ